MIELYLFAAVCAVVFGTLAYMSGDNGPRT